MNTKPFVAITIFLLLFSITSYSLENSAFAESNNETQESPQTTVRALTGRWRGKANWTATYDYYPDTVKCKYKGTFTLNLRQKNDDVTGNVSTSNAKVSGDEECDENLSPSGAVKFTVFGSGFSGTIGGLISITDGQFTSDTMRGSFSGDVGGGVTVTGKFKANRVSSSSSQ